MGKVLLKHFTNAPIDLLLSQGIKSKFLVDGASQYFQEFVYLSVVDEIDELSITADTDFVLVEVNDSLCCYDHAIKNDKNPINRRSMTISNFLKSRENGNRPFQGMAEVLVKYKVESEKIVAFAKSEKFFPSNEELSTKNEEMIKEYINQKFKDYVFFKQINNTLLYYDRGFLDKNKKGYHLRIVFDKDKVVGHESKIKSFFDSFSSIEELSKLASKSDRECKNNSLIASENSHNSQKPINPFTSFNVLGHCNSSEPSCH